MAKPSRDRGDVSPPAATFQAKGVREDDFFYSAEESDERLAFADRPDKSPAGGPAATQPARDGEHFHGHRERLRKRFRDQGEGALADYELLELALFRLIPRRDTKPIAKALIDRFGSLSAAMNAPEKRLCEISGIGESVATDLKLIAAINQRMLKSELRDKPLLSSWSTVIDYCSAAMAHETREQFRILFLDKRNKLIADEVQGVGTVDHTPVYPREVVRRALELSATALILVHNHPSGDPTPSRADIDMTQQIVQTAKPLGIVVHDHVIIGKGTHASLRGLKLI